MGDSVLHNDSGPQQIPFGTVLVLYAGGTDPGLDERAGISWYTVNLRLLKMPAKKVCSRPSCFIPTDIAFTVISYTGSTAQLLAISSTKQLGAGKHYSNDAKVQGHGRVQETRGWIGCI